MSLTMEPTVRVGVTVTFLRMDAPPPDPRPPLPPGADVHKLAECSVEQYRFLYNTVGGPYLWWLRRILPDRQLATILRDPRVTIHILYRDGTAAGFYELDATPWPTVNLSYFGLLPHAIGTGVGYRLLRHAVGTVWSSGAQAMTVNTCTADHPRALPSYLRAGFRRVREVREEWNIPVRLGLQVPAQLRV